MTCKCIRGASNRAQMFLEFVPHVMRHIDEYAVPQYGDYPNDPLNDYNEDQIITQIRRYVSRLDSNQRGPIEAERDLFKMVHYIQTLWGLRGRNHTDAIMNGEEEGDAA